MEKMDKDAADVLLEFRKRTEDLLGLMGAARCQQTLDHLKSLADGKLTSSPKLQTGAQYILTAFFEDAQKALGDKSEIYKTDEQVLNAILDSGYETAIEREKAKEKKSKTIKDEGYIFSR